MLDTSSITGDSFVGQGQFGAEKTGNEMGRDEFLKLLTVQLQNQDPMSPMESQDFSAQIAQFSQVEQLENMSKGMDKSNEIDLMLTQAITNTISTTLVGKRAKVAGDQVMITKDGTAEVSFKLDRSASTVKINIRDAKGNTVRTIEKTGMVEGNHTVNWDGLDKNGEKISRDKEYTFEVEAVDSDGNSVPATPYMVGVIQGVEYADNSTLLIMNTGQKAPFSTVLEVIAPEDF